MSGDVGALCRHINTSELLDKGSESTGFSPINSDAKCAFDSSGERFEIRENNHVNAFGGSGQL